MRISETMDLGELRDRMGDADTAEAAALRDLLTETDHAETDSIPESEWLALLDQAIINAKGGLDNATSVQGGHHL